MRHQQPAGTQLPIVAGIALLGLAFILLGALSAPRANAQTNPNVDFDGFRALTEEVAPHRESRLVDLDTFSGMRADPGTLVIDARSAEAYAMGHIEGAVNLNFADFTDARLAEVIGDTGRRILIYCNNNFEDDVPPVVLKRAPLALNIATYVNLYGYGYTNVYELEGSYSFTDPRMHWTGEAPPAVL